MPTFVWTGPHENINNLTSISYGIILSDTAPVPDSQYISRVSFTPLRASHEGKYTCSISSPESSIDIEVTVNG